MNYDDFDKMCMCTMAQKLVGDGCDICNPDFYESVEIKFNSHSTTNDIPDTTKLNAMENQ